MAFTAITAGEADANSPADATLWGKVKDNFDDHESRLTIVEGAYITDANWKNFVGSDTVAVYNDSGNVSIGLGQTSYILLKTLTTVKRYGTARIKFDLQRTAGPGWVNGKIYKNGSPVGTERTSDAGNWTTFSEDFTGVVPGDVFTLYGKTSGGSENGQVREFKLTDAQFIWGID